jgi:hypothetical protein
VPRASASIRGAATNRRPQLGEPSGTDAAEHKAAAGDHTPAHRAATRSLADRALAPGEYGADPGPPAARERLGHLGEPLEQRVLGSAVTPE